MKLKKWVQGILVVILILSSITMMLTIDSDFNNWGLLNCGILVTCKDLDRRLCSEFQCRI